ncbi:MAG: hypothetical protein ACRD40_12415 [Candidatus Acidiferrales bacterium]
MVRSLVVVAALLASGVCLQAQDATPKSKTAAPTVNQIIGHYVAAIGGRAAIEKITSTASLGRIEVPSMKLSGTVMIHEKAPDKTLQVVVFNGSAFRQGFDGTTAWTDDPADGLRVLSGIELAEAKRDADFFRPLHLHEIYPSLTFAGAEKVGDRDAYVLAGTAADESEPDKMYFDAENGLALRIVNPRHTPDGEAKLQEDFSDYRRVDGVELPFTIAQTGGSANFTIHISEIHHEVDLDDTEFAKPQGGDSKVQ